MAQFVDRRANALDGPGAGMGGKEGAGRVGPEHLIH
jgi:hypothetical protein